MTVNILCLLDNADLTSALSWCLDKRELGYIEIMQITSCYYEDLPRKSRTSVALPRRIGLYVSERKEVFSCEAQ